MNVYAIHTGCKYEGGATVALYANKEKAIDRALELVKEEQRNVKRIHKKAAVQWAWSEVERKEHWDKSIIKRWENLVDEIVIYEQEVIE